MPSPARRAEEGGRRGSRLDCSFPEVAVRGGSTENIWGRRGGGRKPPEGEREAARGTLGWGLQVGRKPHPALELPTWLVFLAPASQSAQSRNGSSCGGHLPPGSGSARWRTGKHGLALNWSHGAWVPSWASLLSSVRWQEDSFLPQKLARGITEPTRCWRTVGATSRPPRVAHPVPCCGVNGSFSGEKNRN